MFKLYFIVFALLLSVNIIICKDGYFDPDIHVDAAVQFYNSIPGLSWRAGTNGLGQTIKLSQITQRLGLIRRQMETNHEAPSTNEVTEDDDLPEFYDARQAYPNCTTIRSIKDQSNCGSCWAISVASAFSDRLCIHSNGIVNFNMSADQLLACDKKSRGCVGGHLDTAWQYIANEGLITGGDYGSNEGCRPYSIPPGESWFAPSSISQAETPKCGTNECPDMFKAEYSSIVIVHSNEYLIRKEIFENGPISAGMLVYLSFVFYESGIYSKPFHDILPIGLHSVRVIGWGELNGEKYWLVTNSWGTAWGENGCFKILRGTNECELESAVIAGLPEF